MKNTCVIFFNDIVDCQQCKIFNKNYFVIKSDDNKPIKVCEACMVHYPSIMLQAAGNKKAMTKTYHVNGVFDKRQYNKNNFAITLSKKKPTDSTELYNVLKYLEVNGYNVQLFGYKTVQIGVKDHRTNLVQGQYYALKLKLEYWENIQYNTEGFKLIIVE